MHLACEKGRSVVKCAAAPTTSARKFQFSPSIPAPLVIVSGRRIVLIRHGPYAGLDGAGVPKNFDVTYMTIHEAHHVFGVHKKHPSAFKQDRSKSGGVSRIMPREWEQSRELRHQNGFARVLYRTDLSTANPDCVCVHAEVVADPYIIRITRIIGIRLLAKTRMNDVRGGRWTAYRS